MKLSLQTQLISSGEKKWTKNPFFCWFSTGKIDRDCQSCASICDYVDVIAVLDMIAFYRIIRRKRYKPLFSSYINVNYMRTPSTIEHQFFTKKKFVSLLWRTTDISLKTLAPQIELRFYLGPALLAVWEFFRFDVKRSK